MFNRRMVIAGGVALGATAAAGRAAQPAEAKRRAIAAVAMPANFNGLIAYGRSGRVEAMRCVGMADVESRRPVTPDTRFMFGSASKWLVSCAVLRLVEQGRLSLDAPIVTYLPDFRRDTGERVLLRHLLSNTSGIPDLMIRQVKVEPALRQSTATAAEMVARFAGGDLAFAPGTGWDYTPINWTIVDAILERMTGEPLPAAVARLVFRPLKMRETGFAIAGEPPLPMIAAAYTDTTPPVRKMAPVPRFVAASGSVAGTAADAMRAAHGIFHGALLRPASRAALTTVRWPAQSYALGGRIQPIDVQSWAWETGKVEGYRSHIAHRLSRSETIVVFNNTDLDQSMIDQWVEAIARA